MKKVSRLGVIVEMLAQDRKVDEIVNEVIARLNLDGEDKNLRKKIRAQTYVLKSVAKKKKIEVAPKKTETPKKKAEVAPKKTETTKKPSVVKK